MFLSEKRNQSGMTLIFNFNNILSVALIFRYVREGSLNFCLCFHISISVSFELPFCENWAAFIAQIKSQLVIRGYLMNYLKNLR